MILGLRKTIDNESILTVVYLAKEKDVIEVVAGLELSSLDQDFVYLENLFVRQDYRGKGIAKDLIRWAKGKCMTLGKERLSLFVRKGNRTAIDLYEAEGFDYLDSHFGLDYCMTYQFSYPEETPQQKAFNECCD